MTELWFIGIIAFLGLLLTIFSSKDNFSDNRYRWYKRLTKRGFWILFLGITLVLISIIQGLYVKKNEKQIEIIEAKTIIYRDSIIADEIKKGVDLSRQQLFSDISEAFAKQSFKLDTVSKSIENLRDSAKTVIINSPKDDPIIIIREDGISFLQKNDTIEFKIQIVSTQAQAHILFVNFFCEINFTDGSTFDTMIAKRLFQDVIILPKEQPISNTFEVYTSAKRKINFVNIAIYGKYTPFESSKEILIQDLYKYSNATKKCGFVPSKERDIFFKKYCIKFFSMN